MSEERLKYYAPLLGCVLVAIALAIIILGVAFAVKGYSPLDALKLIIK